jgi:uncharacterized alpha-E superfamily protein
VADHCFWLGRYLERVEATARLLEATRGLSFDGGVAVTQCWTPLVIVSGEHPSFVERYGSAAAGDGEIVQGYMTWDEHNQVSLTVSMQAARTSAQSIRDVLSLEVWEEINELYLWLSRESTRRLYAENREEVFRHVRRSVQLSLGMIRGTMLHDTPMSFLWLGAMLERVGQTARILDMHHHTMERERAHDIVQVALWLSLLRACSGFEAFMKRNQGRVSAAGVVAFLLFEEQFPRSLRYCLRSSASILGGIWGDERGHASLSRLRELDAWLDAQRRSFDVQRVHLTLTHIVDETSRICADIGLEIQGPPVDGASQAAHQQ